MVNYTQLQWQLLAVLSLLQALHDLWGAVVSVC